MSEVAAMRHAALHDLVPAQAAAEAPVVLEERRLVGIIDLRLDGSRRAAQAAVKKASGLGLPRAAGTSVATDTRMACWLGPDEWLLLLEPHAEAATLAALQDALAGQHFALTAQGAAYAVIRVRGERAAEVLAQGCTLDLHPAQLAPGRCAQTRVARVGALLLVRDGEHAGFDLLVRRSFAAYLWRWLTDAAAGYGVTTGAGEGL